MTNLNALTIAQARDGLRSRAFSAKELAQSCIKATQEAQDLNATIRLDVERALADAVVADTRLEAGQTPNLCGIPIGVKDIFCVKGQQTQCASRILEGFIPTYESTVTARLWESGAVLMGTLNMDEFAMGSSTETSCYGPAVNPWRVQGKKLTPGGSSGGSAAAVGADMLLGAIGTDTGGSIRQPASYTATVGIKPTYGLCSRYGIIAFASSLDQAGTFSKTVRDGAIMLGAIAGHDPKDSTSVSKPVPDYEALLGQSVKGKRIGIPREYRVEGMPDEVENLWQKTAAMFRDLGAEIVDISLPMTPYALATYYVIAPAEASSNLARYDGVRYGRRAKIEAGESIYEMYAKTRGEGFGDEVKRRILTGTYVLSSGFYDAYYTRAQKIRTLIKKDFDQVYADGIDAILAPSTPSPAFEIGNEQTRNPINMYLNDVFTVPANMAGLPALSLPAGLSAEGLPLGMQLIGRYFGESELLQLAYALEDQIKFAHEPQKWWLK